MEGERGREGERVEGERGRKSEWERGGVKGGIKVQRYEAGLRKRGRKVSCIHTSVATWIVRLVRVFGPYRGRSVNSSSLGPKKSKLYLLGISPSGNWSGVLKEGGIILAGGWRGGGGGGGG